MGGLFDIGKSGLETYKHALSVTGQNIANAGTEGYHRRDMRVAERQLIQSDSLSVQDQLGLGTEIEKVSRAFDALSYFKLIKTNSSFESAKTVSDNMVNLERSVLKGNQNIFTDLNGFFESLNGVQISPNGTPERQDVLLSAQRVASRIASLGAELTQINADLFEEAKISVGSANQIIDGIVEVQKSLQTVGSPVLGPSSLLDQRDQLLKDLSGHTDISIQYKEAEKVRVGLGQSFGANDLIDSFQFKQLSVQEDKGKLNYYMNGAKTDQITGGQLGGLVKVNNIVEETINNLNDFAISLAREFNDLQKVGVDLNGNQGTSLFSIPTIELVTGDGSISKLSFAADALLGNEYSLKYQSDKNSFLNMSDSSEIQLNGGYIKIGGNDLFLGNNFTDQEVITLKPIKNIASNIDILLNDPKNIAAAKSVSVKNSANNIGNSIVSVSASRSKATSTKLSVVDDFKGNIDAANPKAFLSNSHVSTIDADISKIKIDAFVQQSSTRFTLTNDNITSLKSSQITFDMTTGDDQVFNIGAKSDLWTDLSTLSDLLNNGTIKSGSGNDIKSLGLVAVANQNTIAFTQANNVTNRVTAVQLLGTTENMAPAPTSNSDVYVFTKEGRQISGPTLTDAEALELLVPANGFNLNAIYRNDYANGSYRGSFSDVKYFSGSPESPTGFLKESASADGAIKNIEFFLEDKSFQTQSNVTKATSNSIDAVVGVKINDDFQATLNFAEEADLDITKVSQHMASGLRKKSSANSVTTLSFDASVLNKIEPFSVVFEGQKYSGKIIFPKSFDETLTIANVILEGLEDRFTPVVKKKDGNAGFDLSLTSKDGVPTSESIQIISENTKSVTQQTVIVETGIAYENFSADLGQLKLGNGSVVDLGTMTTEGGVVGNFKVDITNKSGKAEITIKTNVGTDTFRYQPADTIAAATNILSKRISVAKDILTIQELDGGANDVDINFQTNIKSTTTLSDLPEEELLLVLEDTSNTKFSVDYSTEPVPGLSSTNFKLSLKSAEFGVYELSDADTGQSIATRTIDKDGSIIVNDLKFKVSGTPAEGDSFVVSKSFASSLKSDNIDDMLKIAKFDAANKSGEFNTKLDALLFGLSKHVSSAEIYKEAAEGSKIAIEEMIDKFSSVSLDTEAANLMQQQQAYQALARVLSTAKEMIDTLMEVI